MITKIAAFVFKYSILFPGCFVPLLFPGIVDMMARSIVRRHGSNSAEFDNGAISILYYGAYIDIWRLDDGFLVPVSRSSPNGNGWIERGFWLLRLWWAL